MGDITEQRRALLRRVLEGSAASTAEQRRAAFDGTGPDNASGLVAKVRDHAYKVTDEDIAAAKAGGLSEDKIFELVVCTAIGQANRQLEGALAALAEATR